MSIFIQYLKGKLDTNSCTSLWDSKDISVADRGALLGCQILRIPHCLDNKLTDDSEDIRPVRWPFSTPQKHFYFCLWYSFVLEAE
jgi:hypothetical protein